MTDKRTSEKTEEELNRDFELYVQSKTVNGRYCPTPDFCCYPELEDMFSYSCEESSTCYVEQIFCESVDVLLDRDTEIEQNCYEPNDVFSDCDSEIEEYYTNYSLMLYSSPISSPTSVMSLFL